MFGDKLKALRISRGMSKNDLAGILNVHPTSIGKYENNGVIPNIDTCRCIASIFDVSLDYLMDNIGTNPSKPSVSYPTDLSVGEYKKLCEHPDVLLDMFYSLSPVSRMSVASHIKILYDLESGKNKSS